MKNRLHTRFFADDKKSEPDGQGGHYEYDKDGNGSGTHYNKWGGRQSFDKDGKYSTKDD